MRNLEKRLAGLVLLLLSPFFVSTARASNPIQLENAKPGTSDWQITNYALNHEIEGYASLTSVNRGGQIQLFVNTADRNFTIEIFRAGWYGGMGGRRITSAVQLAGTAQPACPTTDQSTGLIECNWTNPYVLQVPNNTADPTDWASGVYLAKLTGASGKQAYIVFTVRDDSRPSSYLFQNSVNTYQAYNNWGGRSLYAYNSDFQARKVSFNRPYADSYGAGQFLFEYEYPTVRFLEREGYDLTYATDVDLHENPNLLASKQADLIIGHGEYWSWEMRTNVEAARDRGVSLGFFSANDCYWQVRFEPSVAGGVADRTMVGYKDFALTEDPDYTGGDPSKYHLVTTNWRAFPVNRPEDALIGVLYSNVVQTGDIVVFNASNFVFNNTGLQNGSHIPGLMGVEVDTLGSNTPPGTVLLSHSPYQFQGSTLYSDMTVYTAASGATVFAAGTIIWDQGLDDFNGGPLSAAAQQMTRNLLARFVSNLPLVANPGGPYSGTVSQSVQFDGSGSTDSNGTITSYAWDFGDGGTGTGVTTSHPYSAAGTYTVSLTVTDNNGAQNTAQTTATISNSSSVSLSSVSVNPASVTGGTSSTGTVTLSGAAPAGGASVSLSSSNTAAAQVPASVTVAAGSTTATFTVTTSSVASVTSVTITGTYNSSSKTATLTVNPVSVSGQIAFVQQKTATYSSVSSVVATLSAAPHPGSALVLFSANNNVVVTGVTGGGVTWVRASSGGSHSDLDVWYGLNSSGSGTAITVSYTDATGSGGVNVSEFSGVATSNAVDVAPATTAGITTTPTTPTAATNNANDLIVAAAADTSVAATTAGPTNSFIALAEAANSNKIIPAYRIVSATGSYSTGWTEGNGGWDSAIVALKAAGTSSGPSLSSVTLNPTSVTGGSSSTGTVTLSGAAPTGGATVGLTSSNTTAAQVPANVTVAAGATTATFTVTTSAVGSVTTVTITGSYNGTKTATLTVNPAATVSLSSVTLNPTSVTGGSSSTGTVTLSGAAPTGGATVGLTSSNTAAAQVPASVSVTAGSTTATFTVTTSSVASVTTVTITGSYNGTKTATLTVNPVSVSGQIAFIQQKTATYSSVSSVVATLGAAPHPGSALVLFSANNNVNITGVSGGGVTWVRASASSSHSVVEIWYGLNSSGSGTAVTVTYTDATGSGGVNVSEFSGVATSNALDVVPAPTTGTSTTPSTPVAVTNNANDLILAAAAETGVGATTAGPTNSFVALTEAANSNKIIPAYRIVSVTGSYSTSWTEPNNGWDAIIVGLKAAGTSSGPSLSSVTLNPTSVTGGSSSTGTVTLSGAAPTGGATVTLTSNNTTAAQVPANVTVAAGATTATFTVTTSAVGSVTTVTITGGYNSGTQTATLTVNPAATVSLSSVTLNPTSVTGGSSSTGTVTLSGAAPTGGASVSLTSSNTAAAQVPASVSVTAGSTTATFTVTTSSVASVTTVTVTGSYNGTKTATLTVNPTATVSLSSVTLNPTSVTGGSSSTGTVTLSGAAPTGGASVSLTSSNTAAAQVPTNVTVAAGSTTATFTVTTSAVASVTTVTVTGSYNGTKTATLTVNPPAAVSLSSVSVNPTSVAGGNSSTGTVTLSGAAPTGGAIVTLTSNNTAAAQVPASVTVAAGATSASFQVTTSKVGSRTIVTITGSYNNLTRTARLTVRR